MNADTALHKNCNLCHECYKKFAVNKSGALAELKKSLVECVPNCICGYCLVGRTVALRCSRVCDELAAEIGTSKIGKAGKDRAALDKIEYAVREAGQRILSCIPAGGR